MATRGLDELLNASTGLGFDVVADVYVEFLMSDDRWAELHQQWKSNDDGNSHALLLDTYMRVVAEHRRIKAGRDGGFHREDYLLSLDELQRIADARHLSRRG